MCCMLYAICLYMHGIILASLNKFSLNLILENLSKCRGAISDFMDIFNDDFTSMP
jgi:hypothetical protein